MPDRPPYYHQETDYSCGAACLRMVLAHLKMILTEGEIRALADTTNLPGRFGGTSPLHIVGAVRKLGFEKSSKDHLTFEELARELILGFFPIVYIAIRGESTTRILTHSVVVVEITGSEVIVLDPASELASGEVAHPLAEFNRVWGLTNGLTILVK